MLMVAEMGACLSRWLHHCYETAEQTYLFTDGKASQKAESLTELLSPAGTHCLPQS